MTGIKRVLTTLGLALTIVLGIGLPASATFADTTSLPAMSISTVTVAAPGNVLGGLACAPSSSTMSAGWTAPATKGLSGYRVTVYFSDGFNQISDVGPSVTSWSSPIPTYNVTAYSVRYSVTTLTSYGWKKESVQTGWFRC